MANIIKTNIDLSDGFAVYEATKAKGRNASKITGTYNVLWYCFYQEDKGDGKTQEVLTIGLCDAYGETTKLQSISPTLMRDFGEIVDYMEDGVAYAIEVMHDITKAGREFVTVELRRPVPMLNKAEEAEDADQTGVLPADYFDTYE